MYIIVINHTCVDIPYRQPSVADEEELQSLARRRETFPPSEARDSRPAEKDPHPRKHPRERQRRGPRRMEIR